MYTSGRVSGIFLGGKRVSVRVSKGDRVRGKCLGGKKNSTTPKKWGLTPKTIPLIRDMYYHIRHFEF
jgi:hypothetical protein